MIKNQTQSPVFLVCNKTTKNTKKEKKKANKQKQKKIARETRRETTTLDTKTLERKKRHASSY